MSCALTKGFTLGCKDGIGGIKEIYLTEFSNKATLTETSGVITAFTLSAGKQFWKYELPDNTSSLIETINTNLQNGTTFYSQVVNFILNKLQTAIRNEMKLVAQARLMIIILDRNGTYWLIGKSIGANLTEGSAVTGLAKGDLTGYNMSVLAEESEPMSEVTAGLMATLILPA